MPAQFYPTRGHLLLCQSSSCQNRGSGLLYKALWQHLEQQRWAYYKSGGGVRLTESSCLGACSFGPTLCVYRQGLTGLEQGWYAAVDFPLAVQIAQAVQEQQPLPEERRYGPPSPQSGLS